MATTVVRNRARRGADGRRRPPPPMGVCAAIATLGAHHVALALAQHAPFGALCRQQIDATLGAPRTAWRSLAQHGPRAVREALACQRIFLFPDRRAGP